MSLNINSVNYICNNKNNELPVNNFQFNSIASIGTITLSKGKRQRNDENDFSPNKKMRFDPSNESNMDLSWAAELLTTMDIDSDSHPETEWAKRERSKSPVTTKAIEMQAKLMQTKIQAQSSMLTNSIHLMPKKSHNTIYQILDPHDLTKIKAYFKVSDDFDPATNIMEKLVWDLALIMGCEEFFVPTCLFQTPVGIIGSLQPLQEGKILKDFNGSDLSIETSHLLKALLASIFFGMYDLYDKNLIIDTKGHIHFFDNTRSLPHSNGFINRGDFLVSAFRCCFLQFKAASFKFTNEDKEIIEKTLNDWTKRLPLLKQYLNSSYVQKLLKNMPTSWFNVSDVLNVLNEKIEFLKLTVQENSSQTMLDLVTRLNPDYKFSFALCIAKAYFKNEEVFLENKTLILDYIHNLVGQDSTDELVDFLTTQGYSVKNIRKIATKPYTSWQEMCDQVINELELGPFYSKKDLMRLKNEERELMFTLSVRSKLDKKDFN